MSITASITKLKLKPCPFCGGQARMLPQSQEPFGKHYSVDCVECGVKMKIFTKFKKQAALTWNMRKEELK